MMRPKAQTTKHGYTGGKVGAEFAAGDNGAVEVGFKADRSDYKFEDVKMDETNLGLYAGYNFKF